jgi:hypothetical protein
MFEPASVFKTNVLWPGLYGDFIFHPSIEVQDLGPGLPQKTLCSSLSSACLYHPLILRISDVALRTMSSHLLAILWCSLVSCHVRMFNLISMGFKVLMAVAMKIAVFRHVTPWRMADATDISEASGASFIRAAVHIYQTTRRHPRRREYRQFYLCWLTYTPLISLLSGRRI